MILNASKHVTTAGYVTSAADRRPRKMPSCPSSAKRPVIKNGQTRFRNNFWSDRLRTAFIVFYTLSIISGSSGKAPDTITWSLVTAERAKIQVISMSRCRGSSSIVWATSCYNFILGVGQSLQQVLLNLLPRFASSTTLGLRAFSASLLPPVQGRNFEN